jgi:preprotein translocase subunit SecG
MSAEVTPQEGQAAAASLLPRLTWQLVFGFAILLIQIALALFLVEDSARFYTAGGQQRPFVMAVLTEAALIVCAMINFREKTWWLANKAMLVAIVLFVVFLMQENASSQLEMSTFRHASLSREIETLEKHNGSLQKSIVELEARSRVTAAGKLHQELATNHAKVQALREEQRTLAKPMTQAEASIMFYFRLGAILLTIILAGYQRSEFKHGSPNYSQGHYTPAP